MKDFTWFLDLLVFAGVPNSFLLGSKKENFEIEVHDLLNFDFNSIGLIHETLLKNKLIYVQDEHTYLTTLGGQEWEKTRNPNWEKYCELGWFYYKSSSAFFFKTVALEVNKEMLFRLFSEQAFEHEFELFSKVYQNTSICYWQVKKYTIHKWCFYVNFPLDDLEEKIWSHEKKFGGIWTSISDLL